MYACYPGGIVGNTKLLFPIRWLITSIKSLQPTHHATLVEPGQIDDTEHNTHHNPLERCEQTDQGVEEEEKVVHHVIQTSV